MDDSGQVVGPLAKRSIEAFKLLQKNAQTIIVLPAELSGLYEVELPWLGERKARAAIPFALEEQLAQSVATLHFSFDRAHYHKNRYLVVVIDKQFLVDLMAKLDGFGLDFDCITLDWFALNEQEACITSKGLLIHEKTFKGALSSDVAFAYLGNASKDTQILRFKDSVSNLKATNVKTLKTDFYTWIAGRLLKTSAINLCQADLQHDNGKQLGLYWYKASAIALAFLLVCGILMKALQVHLLNTRIANVDKEIATVYQVFFPGANQVISPKFRISQLLKGGSQTSPLWHLLDKLARVSDSTQITIQDMRFQGKGLVITLKSKNFTDLERLQSRLRNEKIKVTQVQASSQDQQVLATLELTL
jgi:general secretion pathway protein L